MKILKFFNLLLLILFLTGCNKNKAVTIDDIVSYQDSINTYEVDGKMKLNRGSNVITFDFEVSYLSPDMYKVKLTNDKSNNSQILLKNENGVFILTPTLNKKLNFKSDWPNNSSHSYLYQSLINDVKNDGDAELVDDTDKIIIKTKCQIANGQTSINEDIIFSKVSKMPKEVTVYNSDHSVKSVTSFNDFKVNKKIEKTSFDEDKIMTESISSNGDGELLKRDFKPLELEGYVASFDEETEDKRTMRYKKDDKMITIIETKLEVLEVSCVTKYFDDAYLNDYTFTLLSANSLTFYDMDMEFVIYFNDAAKEDVFEISNILLD